MWLPVRSGVDRKKKSEQERLKETLEVIMDTRFPNEDVIYIKERQIRAIVEEEKKLYMNIFMSTQSWEK